jgi:hypothetical protein
MVAIHAWVWLEWGRTQAFPRYRIWDSRHLNVYRPRKLSSLDEELSIRPAGQCFSSPAFVFLLSSEFCFTVGGQVLIDSRMVNL